MLVLVPRERRAPAVQASVAIVSPHPDDALLSAGGLLQRFAAAVVVNVFSDETWTWRPHYAARPALTRRLVVEEERVACTVAGAEARFLGMVDGASRPGLHGAYLVEPAEDGHEDAEPRLRETLLERLGDEVRGSDFVLAPLGVGGHVDHVHCREAVLACVAAGELAPRSIALYDDLPYSWFESAGAVARRLSSRLAEALSPVTVELCERERALKDEALHAYRVQLTKALARRAMTYAAESGGGGPAERVWTIGEPDARLRRAAEA
jgi:LmbE family N-acetylglucosaminyl deacetylase